MDRLGDTWLQQHFDLKSAPLTHESYVGVRARRETHATAVVEAFSPAYRPGDVPLGHVEFALKYDDLNLDLLRQVFHALPTQEVVRYIERQPSGRYTRARLATGMNS